MTEVASGRASSTNGLERASVAAGFAAPVVTLGAILVATLVSPSFAWRRHALSELGAATGAVATSATRVLFNGGLLVGAVVALGFGYALLRRRRNVVELVGIGCFGLVVIAQGLIGVFALPHPFHGTVAISFFALLSVALWVYGVGNYLAGAAGRGVLTVVAGLLNVTAWVIWNATGEFARPGLALPEIVGSVLFAAWAISTALDLRSRRRASA
jgi:hypothetical membrane protein